MKQKTTFKFLREELRKENEENLIYQLNKLNGSTEGNNQQTKEEALIYCVRWTLEKRTPFKGTYEEQRFKCETALNQRYKKQLDLEYENLSRIEDAEITFPNPLTITVEWIKSYTWGSNPRASDNYGNTSGSIGGCGYDKLSTAVSRVLNQHDLFLKLMCIKKEAELKQGKKPFYIEQNGMKQSSQQALNSHLFGYGSGYGIIPSFCGGVGVSSTEGVIESLGFQMKHICNTKHTDVFYIIPLVVK